MTTTIHPVPRQAPRSLLKPLAAAGAVTLALLGIFAANVWDQASYSSATTAPGVHTIAYGLQAPTGFDAPVQVTWMDPRTRRTHTETVKAFPWTQLVDTSSPDAANVKMTIDNRRNSTRLTGAISANGTSLVLRKIDARATAEVGTRHL